MHDSRNKLDRLLDSALADYADPGPDSGLESRILSGIPTETHATPRHRRLAWAIALPAAAILLLFIRISHPWTHRTSTMPQQANVSHRSTPFIATVNHPRPQVAQTRNSDALLQKDRPRHKALAARPVPLPKLDLFPTPQPLTPQERALVDFASHASNSERESLIAAQQQANAPLQISAIQIKPLPPPVPDTN